MSATNPGATRWIGVAGIIVAAFFIGRLVSRSESPSSPDKPPGIAPPVVVRPTQRASTAVARPLDRIAPPSPPSHADTAMSDEQILEVATRSLTANPNDVDALSARAMVFIRMKRNDDALADLNQILQLNPDGFGSSANFYRGMLLFERSPAMEFILSKDLKLAVADFETVLQSSLGSDVKAMAQLFLSMIWERALHHDKALVAAEAALRLDPQDETVQKWHRALPTRQYLSRVFFSLKLNVGQLKPDTPVDQRVSRIRATAEEIGQLSTVGVDPDAVRLGLATRRWLRSVADHAVYSNDPMRLVEGLVRGYNGDPFGTFLEMQGAEGQLGQETQEWRDTIVETSAILSARYGMQF